MPNETQRFVTKGGLCSQFGSCEIIKLGFYTENGEPRTGVLGTDFSAAPDDNFPTANENLPGNMPGRFLLFLRSTLSLYIISMVIAIAHENNFIRDEKVVDCKGNIP